MEELKAVPRKGYWFLLTLIDMILLFIYSIFNLTKPSDALTRDEIDSIRRTSMKEAQKTRKRLSGPNGEAMLSPID